MDEATIKLYSKVMDDIINETGGEYDEMTLEQKLTVIAIMKKVDKQMTEYIAYQSAIVKAWSSLSIEDIILAETECYLNL
ncbi:MAG TPA: hypothetical protein GXX63_02175 [Tissierellia bacterium]|nr:hypothetical protein [Tissierellia bacterium]